MTIRKKGEKTRYSFVDAGCLGRKCFAPGFYQHRAPMAGGGSRNTGSPDTPCCLNRAYHGCPNGPLGESVEICTHCESFAPEVCGVCNGTKKFKVLGLPEVDPALRNERVKEGWKVAR
jgi:hypothetical protein